MYVSSQHARGAYVPDKHSRPLNLAIGAGVMSTLVVGALRFSGWPLSPVGYLLSTSIYMNWIWWSVFLGWIAKLVVVRLGGVQGYRAARPIFIGMIFGEALAVVFWVVVNIILAQMNIPYLAVRILPT